MAEDPVAKSVGVEPSTRSVLQWFSRATHEWLLIFDNADGHPQTITKFMPTGNRGNVLITSRNPMMGQHVSSPSARVEVDAMNEDDAVLLLLKSAFLEESSSNVVSLARAIVRQLCFLPLAVDQAGAAIAGGLCNIHDYLHRYSVRRKELMTLPLFEGASTYGKAVYATWELSCTAIQDSASGASTLMTAVAAQASILLLEIFSCFHNENIMEEIFRRAAELHLQSVIDMKPMHESVPALLDLLQLDSSGEWNLDYFRAGIQILNSFSLVKRNAGGDSYSLHPLVHMWNRDRMSDKLRQVRCRLASSLLAQSITSNNLVADYAFRRDLIPHIEACRLRVDEIFESDIRTGRELTNFALAYDENGLWDRAVVSLVRAAELAKEVAGEEHPDTLFIMYKLASVYRSQGRFKEAGELGLQVLESRKRVLGDEHPATLRSMTYLVLVYRSQGRSKEAEELGLKVLELKKKVHGEEHPETLTSMNNLVPVYHGQGRSKEAEELGLKVLGLKKKVLGTEHPATLTSMSNLVSVYQSQGRSKEAEELGLKVLELKKEVLGEEHPDTLISMNNLASAYRCQGRSKEAEELGLRVLESRKTVLGEEHPDTLSSMNNLAMAYQDQGRFKEAEELGLRVTESWKALLGKEHPDTLTSLDNLARTYHSQGRSEEAGELELEVMDLRKKVLGEEHPDTLMSMVWLAHTLKNLGQDHEAIGLLRRAVDPYAKVLGPDHPETLAVTRDIEEWTSQSS